MPFDPHLIHPEQPPLTGSGDLQLPDDLAELAAQLGDDARHLAATYPAPVSGVQRACDFATPPSPPATSHIARSSRYLPRALTAAAILSAVAASATVWFPRATPSRDITTRSVSEEPILTRRVSEDPSASEESRIVEPTRAPLPPVASRLTSDTPSRSNIVSLDADSSISNQQSPISNPTMFLHEYSGPELEGLYDLIGDEEEENKVSI
jgi:hypothetical protein